MTAVLAASSVSPWVQSLGKTFVAYICRSIITFWPRRWQRALQFIVLLPSKPLRSEAPRKEVTPRSGT